jgi:hypothetical protein
MGHIMPVKNKYKKIPNDEVIALRASRYQPVEGGILDQAIKKLGPRFRYSKEVGYIVDNEPSTFWEVLERARVSRIH